MSEVKNVQKTGCAVIGYGGMGGWHTRYILESDVAYLCGIYDINPVKVELAKTNGIRAYATLEELLADDEIKFVTIATPNEVHAEIAIKALRAGKHVITEKYIKERILTDKYDIDYAPMKQRGKYTSAPALAFW